MVLKKRAVLKVCNSKFKHGIKNSKLSEISGKMSVKISSLSNLRNFNPKI